MIKDVEGRSHYACSENKDADQLQAGFFMRQLKECLT